LIGSWLMRPNTYFWAVWRSLKMKHDNWRLWS
jgi:hypothetical protein